MKKDIFVNRVSNALENDRGAVFVGSGISFSSTEVDWFKLLEPLVNELDITLDNKSDDLPMIAQYIVNNYSGNRGPLVNEISKTFNRKFKLNKYHKYLATTKLSTIWTTNYDMLLEDAFYDFDTSVKVSDDSITRNRLEYDVEIIKMHGCISRSDWNEIVITQEDYDDFSINKPAISQRLSEDLINKSFLFIGYSYRDPNIRNIMINARRLSKKHTQQHYIILKKLKDSDSNITQDDVVRQELWCNDLKRLGISTLFIDEYSELEELLREISQKSRGKTVYVTGSHKESNMNARKLGTKLAKHKDITLLSGQSSGIGSEVVAAFTEECIKSKEDIINRMKIFPNPYSADEKYSDDITLIPDLKKCRTKMLNSTQVVVVFSGGIGTEAEIDVAIKQNCNIIPVITCKEDRENPAIKKNLKL
ncbi:SIR2 family protein [Clostridioides difficile]|uniref:SIR2 family protein n=1 Tax=Clostridioides difficile TaxID=1496 RepID=UPI002FD223A5